MATNESPNGQLIHGIPHDQILSIWPRIRSDVAESCRRGGGKYLAEDILQALEARDMQLWVAGEFEAFAITEIINYPQKRFLRIRMGAGDFNKHFAAFVATAEAWAKTHGCHGGEAITRQGFVSEFKDAGWLKKHIYMEREF